MTSTLKQIRNLFFEISELPPKERAAAVEEKCGSDEELRQQLEQLLKSADEPDSVLDLHAGHFLAPLMLWEPEEYAAGTVIAGRYTLEKKIGAGGMGTVYLARQPHLDKLVALKLLPTDRLENAESITRFQQEMRAVGKIDHSHLVRALDAGEAEEGPYLVMEFLDGLNLSELIKLQGPLSVPDACELIRQAATGLLAAHEHGMIHRDLKPANLMLTRQDYGEPLVKVLDLGLALHTETPASPGELTGEGKIMGTLDYMAPEQLEENNPIGIEVDVYCLGATLFALLAGESPQAHLNHLPLLEKLQAIKTEPLRDLREFRPDLPEAVWTVFNHTLVKDPVARYANMQELIDALTPLSVKADLPPLLSAEVVTSDTTSIFSATFHNKNQPAPQSVTSFRHLATRFPFVVLLVLLIGLPTAGIFYGSTLIRFVNDEAALVLQMEATELGVRIHQDGHVIKDHSGKRTWTLKPRDGELKVYDENGKLLITREFQLQRGGKTVLRVTAESLAAARNSAPQQKDNSPQELADPDRLAALFVLSQRGSVQINDRDEFLLHLRQLPQQPFELSGVRLPSRKELTDEMLACFRNCRHLKSLTLRHSPISDAGLAHFASCKQLEQLFLEGTQIGDQTLRMCREFADLRVLALARTNITGEGLRFLKNCRELREIDLGSTVAGNGLHYLKQCRELRFLGLNSIEHSEEALAQLKLFPHLEGLDLRSIVARKTWAEHVRGCPELKSLSLAGLRVTDDQLVALEELSQLVYLHLGTSRITDAGLAQLRHFQQLRVLVLESNQRLTDAGLVQLSKLKPLRCLYLPDENPHLTEAGISQLKKQLPVCSIHRGLPGKASLQWLPRFEIGSLFP